MCFSVWGIIRLFTHIYSTVSVLILTFRILHRQMLFFIIKVDVNVLYVLFYLRLDQGFNVAFFEELVSLDRQYNQVDISTKCNSGV